MSQNTSKECFSHYVDKLRKQEQSESDEKWTTNECFRLLFAGLSMLSSEIEVLNKKIEELKKS